MQVTAIENHPSMPSEHREDLQTGLIITDDIARYPILDFNIYRDVIKNIVKNSYPKFTIGIFGDWETGKTTLMDSIDRALQDDKNIIRVQFEAWRYEREDQFALVPLLKTIAFALPEEKKFENLKQKLKRGTVNFLKRTPDILSSLLSKYLGDSAGKITKEMFDSFKEDFNSKVELLAEVDRDTLYFDGFEDIRNEINKIRLDNPSFRIVVFVDDLDRCSPKKTLEVLESIKVFLGMEGFIYIIGISHDVVSKLIDIEHEKSGVKGEQYIKKMIQIPITLPQWDNRDISKLVAYFLQKGVIHGKYKETIEKNIDLISAAIENNPREIKRFINHYIVAYEIHSSNKNIDPTKLLIVQAINVRWNGFYRLLLRSNKKFLDEIKIYIEKEPGERASLLESNTAGTDFTPETQRLLRNFKSEDELWKFLKTHYDDILQITDWETYRRATESVKEPSAIPRYRHIKASKMKLMKGKSREYIAGYEAGWTESEKVDDPDPNITPSEVECKGGEPGSDWCRGYQQGYADSDHAMYGD
jgi:predicted KAP-like P-loop ATPase